MKAGIYANMSEGADGVPRGFISGTELGLYKDRFGGNCWWCGSRADSKEHKFKKSDLRRMWGDDDYLLKGDTNTGQLRRVNGPNSQAVKFDAFLCARCNNQRSQRFDYAWDKFAQRAWDDMPRLWYRRYLDFEAIYGSNWAADTEDLARYIIKHVGCRMWDAGFAPPREFARFLDGTAPLHDTALLLVKDVHWWRAYKRNGRKYGGLDISQTTGSVSQSTQRLNAFFGGITVGYVGFRYAWRDGEGPAESFYGHSRVRLIKYKDPYGPALTRGWEVGGVRSPTNGRL